MKAVIAAAVPLFNVAIRLALPKLWQIRGKREQTLDTPWRLAQLTVNNCLQPTEYLRSWIGNNRI